jgi:hypothetical protein
LIYEFLVIGSFWQLITNELMFWLCIHCEHCVNFHPIIIQLIKKSVSTALLFVIIIIIIIIIVILFLFLFVCLQKFGEIIRISKLIRFNFRYNKQTYY